jgi:hypothetical protein
MSALLLRAMCACALIPAIKRACACTLIPAIKLIHDNRDFCRGYLVALSYPALGAGLAATGLLHESIPLGEGPYGSINAPIICKSFTKRDDLF